MKQWSEEMGEISGFDADAATRQIVEMQWVLLAAYQALRSYEYGNSAPGLAQEVCEKIKRVLPEGVLPDELMTEGKA